MISTISPDPEVLIVDSSDYQDQMLLKSLDEKPGAQNDSFSTSLSESTPALADEDGQGRGLLKMENVEELDTKKIAIRAADAIIKSEAPDTKMDFEEQDHGIPGKFDVLCGQSRICANHTGNRRFQIVLDIYAPKYDAATSKQEKMTLTKEIVACIGESGGRFLKYKDGLWQEIATVTARDKVSHALRTKVASWKRQQQQQEDDKKNGGTSTSKTKPSHRRRRSSAQQQRRRRSSASSVATTGSDIVTSSFDGSDPASISLVEDLLKTQREIFATLQQSSSDEHPLKRNR